MKTGFTHESTYNESKEWYTPKYIFDALGIEFDMDVCSPGKDVVSWIPAKKHLTFIEDGLRSGWGGTVWMNPPYGMDTPVWMKKLQKHGDGLALVFSRTDTNWFHDYAVMADAVMFLKKRVQFIQASQADNYSKGIKIKNSGSGAGSMLVAFGEKALNSLLKAESKDFGVVFTPNRNRPVSTLCDTDSTEDGSGVISDNAHIATDCANVNTNANAEPGHLF